MLTIVFVETALELVPFQMYEHPSVRRNAKRRGKKPDETLLDRSLHHFGMIELANSEKRGRPDIIHICLLEALSSPLNRVGSLNVWINTLQDFTIKINPKTRLPRDYNRFKSLIEQVFTNGKAPKNTSEPLLKLKKQSLKELIEELKPSFTIAMTSHGESITLENLGKKLSTEKHPLVFIGAYPSGPMHQNTLRLAKKRFKIYKDPLEAWTVTSRLVYEYEKSIGI